MKNIKSSDIQNYVDSLSELQKSLILEIREVVLNVNPSIEESIKWGSICFHLNGNLCGYRVAKAHVTLLFFEGAALDDKGKILSGTGAKARTFKYDGKNPIPIENLKDLVQQAIALNAK